MTMTDPIADMLTRIRNAQKSNKTVISLPSSKFKLAISKILKEEGYIDDIIQHKKGQKVTLEITLKKIEDHYAISGIEKVSKPGQRAYVGKNKLPRVLGGFGIAIVSTSKGVMTNAEARKNGLGGEVVCRVW